MTVKALFDALVVIPGHLEVVVNDHGDLFTVDDVELVGPVAEPHWPRVVHINVMKREDA